HRHSRPRIPMIEHRVPPDAQESGSPPVSQPSFGIKTTRQKASYCAYAMSRAGHDLRVRPREHRAETRNEQGVRFGARHPAVLVVLRPPEPGGDGNSDARGGAEADPEARHLAARVRLRVAPLVAPAQLDVVDRGLLADLAERGRERRFAGLDDALREIPVPVGAQDEVAPAL